MRADLALVGFGHVGRRFATLLEERRDWLSLDYDLDCRIAGIATARHGCVVAEHGLDAVAAAQRKNGKLQVNGAVPAHDSFEVIRHLARDSRQSTTFGRRCRPAAMW